MCALRRAARFAYACVAYAACVEPPPLHHRVDAALANAPRNRCTNDSRAASAFTRSLVCHTCPTP
ncbi:hypothetical protein B2G74_11010 [Burkholderia sp. A27]|nr:hypothetical protein B2G74_11010 [Burkholderia sp. A27]